MDLYLKNTTFVIVCFKSQEVIYDCLNTLPKEANKIIVENSNNLNLKKDLESKFTNIEVIINKNSGFGASNNLGIKKSKTQFVFILNPDVKFREDTFDNLTKTCRSIPDFAIISPIHSDSKYPNYTIKNKYRNIEKNIIEVDEIDGFSMLINKSKFEDEIYFDENFFLYLENNDLCLRTKKSAQNIFIIKNSLIDHKGGSSTDISSSNEIEYLRNWHWMWSKFYYHKKHFGYLYGFLKIFRNLISAFLKSIIYSILGNNKKKTFYKARLSGCMNGLLLKKSWYRPNI